MRTYPAAPQNQPLRTDLSRQALKVGAHRRQSVPIVTLSRDNSHCISAQMRCSLRSKESIGHDRAERTACIEFRSEPALAVASVCFECLVLERLLVRSDSAPAALRAAACSAPIRAVTASHPIVAHDGGVAGGTSTHLFIIGHSSPSGYRAFRAQNVGNRKSDHRLLAGSNSRCIAIVVTH